MIFGFEFRGKNYHNGHYGVIRRNDKINISDIEHVYKDELDQLGFSCKNNSQWWLHMEPIPQEKGDFIQYLISNKDAEDEISSRMLEIINALEIDSSLISKINADLTTKSSP